MSTGLIWFIILQFVNVVFSTIRSITTIKAKPLIASIISAFSFTFYYVIVKLITEQDLITVGIVTFITNVLGVWLGKWFIDKITPDKLWIYGVTYKDTIYNLDIITKTLDNVKIGYIVNKDTPIKTLQIFSYSQSDSKIIVELLKRYDVKYYAIESKTQKK